MTTLAPGIHNISFEKYCELDAFNNSAGKWLHVSPAHCRAYQQGLLEKDTEAKKFGRILHTAIFEPAAYKKIPVCPFENFRTKDAQQWRDTIGTYITREQQADVAAIVRSVYAHKEAKRLLSQPSGQGERTLVVMDEEYGLLLKARIDFLALAVVDGKSTVNAAPHPHGFPKQASYLRYHVQQAFYQRVMDLLRFKYSGFIFLAFEKEQPYAVSTIELDAVSVNKGTEEVHRLLQLYKDCKEANHWPAYSDKIEPVTIQTWALKDQPFESALSYELEGA